MSAHPRLRDSGNLLLDRLPNDEFERLSPLLQPVSFALKQIVQQFETEIGSIFFPTTALVSLLTVLEEDDPVEALTVGREGFTGLSAVLGVPLSPNRAICQMSGDCFRVPLHPFLELLPRNPALLRLLHRFIAFSLLSTGQAIACNALHPVEARASRWLLTVHDQARRNDFPMTQEFLAFMLGVRRQTVSVVAGTLQTAGLIDYRRGSMVIKNRERLEETACECYGSIRRYYERDVS